MPEIDYKEVYFSEYCKTCKQPRESIFSQAGRMEGEG